MSFNINTESLGHGPLDLPDGPTSARRPSSGGLLGSAKLLVFLARSGAVVWINDVPLKRLWILPGTILAILGTPWNHAAHKNFMAKIWKKIGIGTKLHKNPRKVWSCNRPFQRLATACGCRSNPPESRGQSRAPWHPSSVARTRLWTPNSQRHAPNMCVMCFTALRPPNASWSGVRPPKFANITFLGCPRAWVIHLWSACQGGLIHNGTAVDDEAIAWH